MLAVSSTNHWIEASPTIEQSQGHQKQTLYWLHNWTSICANLQHRSGKAVIPWTDPSDKEATRLRPSALPLSQTDATHPGTNSKSFIIRNQNDFRSWWQSALLIFPKAFSKQSLCHCHHLPTFSRYMIYHISIRLYTLASTVAISKSFLTLHFCHSALLTLWPAATTKSEALPKVFGCKVFGTELAKQALLAMQCSAQW